MRSACSSLLMAIILLLSVCGGGVESDAESTAAETAPSTSVQESAPAPKKPNPVEARATAIVGLGTSKPSPESQPKPTAAVVDSKEKNAKEPVEGSASAVGRKAPLGLRMRSAAALRIRRTKPDPESSKKLLSGAAGFFSWALAAGAKAAGISIPLPARYEDWNSAHFEQATRHRNGRLPEAIAKVASTDQQTEFIDLMRRLLDASAEEAAIEAAKRIPQARQTARPNDDDYDNSDDDDDDDYDDSDDDDDDDFVYDDSDDDDDDDSSSQRRGDGPAFARIGARMEQTRKNKAAAGIRNQTPVTPAEPIPGDGDLSNRDVVRHIIKGILTNNSDDGWEALADVAVGKQRTALDPKQSAIAVTEEVFGSETVDGDRAESLVAAVVRASASAPAAMDAMTSLSVRTMRADLSLPDSQSDAGTESPQNSPGGGSGKSTSRGGFGQLGKNAFRGSQRRQQQGDDDDDDDDDDNGSSTAAVVFQEPTKNFDLPAVNIPVESLSSAADAVRGRESVDAIVTALGTGIDKKLLQFASTVPDPRVRSALFTALNAVHEEGADQFTDVFRPTARDPGLLVVLKSLPRPSARKANARTAQVDPVDHSWSEVTWSVTNTLRLQLRQAAKEKKFEYTGSVPLRMHRGSEPEITIRIPISSDKSTEDSAEELANEAADAQTIVYYSRCKVTPPSTRAVKRITDHYVKRTKGIRHKMRDSLWYDGGRLDKDGTRFSFDVIIEPGVGKSVTIETIAVQTADPVVSVEDNESRSSDTEDLSLRAVSS